ncbi:hypothetical protein BJ973_004758 [Actinoplanes tereljensis]|uniref:Uncharacterized protein n=1 Tax=Paractinoplanes tereljensis TaxID=571912 RepID=A0A919NQI9_9ACTN|nr:hypothetical protein [Actinoplanes tereljensis]GIF21792.1 hypothetical protein Ate02nite_45220 [Actinoplanes tereljensis]
MTAVVENDDLQQRRIRVRQRELLLALEQWGPAYRNVAGDSLRYVFEIAAATEEEQAWLRQQKVPAGARSSDDVRELGRQANADASAAFLAGDYARARDLIDDARVYGALPDGEWARLHQFIDSKV